VIAALLVGAVGGLGLLSATWALVPPRRDLAAAVERFDIHLARTPRVADDISHATSDRLGRWLASRLKVVGVTTPRLRADLALLNRTVESHFVTKLTTAATGLVLPGLVVLVLATAGIGVGYAIPASVALALAAAFWFVPDVSVAQAADSRRDEMRRALSCYLDLVSMALAGGRGAPEALPSAAQIGRGWAFELIADTLTYARYSGGTPWEALRELGERVQVSELRDLGSALSLVADDGAKIRESLKARAATARARQLAESEGSAEKASESIKNAHLLLGFMFLLFLGFPAVAAVLAV
jgi:Flp pilus assembly protein TadB